MEDPRCSAQNADQVAFIWIRNSTQTFSVVFEVAQCWQCHPIASTGGMFQAVPAYCAEAHYDPVVLKAYQDTPQRDPKRICRKPTQRPDLWEEDLERALGRATRQGLHRAARWISNTWSGLWGPAVPALTMTTSEWASRFVQLMGEPGFEALKWAIEDGVEYKELEAYLQTEKAHNGVVRLTANGPERTDRKVFLHVDQEETGSYAPVASPVASQAPGRRSASQGAQKRGGV